MKRMWSEHSLPVLFSSLQILRSGGSQRSHCPGHPCRGALWRSVLAVHLLCLLHKWQLTPHTPPFFPAPPPRLFHLCQRGWKQYFASVTQFRTGLPALSCSLWSFPTSDGCANLSKLVARSFALNEVLASSPPLLSPPLGHPLKAGF